MKEKLNKIYDYLSRPSILSVIGFIAVIIYLYVCILGLFRTDDDAKATGVLLIMLVIILNVTCGFLRLSIDGLKFFINKIKKNKNKLGGDSENTSEDEFKDEDKILKIILAVGTVANIFMFLLFFSIIAISISEELK